MFIALIREQKRLVFFLTSDSQVDGVGVRAVVVGQLELVHVAVCRMGPIDSQRGDVTVLAIGLSGSLRDETTVPRAGCQDDVAAGRVV